MRKTLAALSASLLVLGLAPALALSAASPAAAEDNGLALTPPMGFNDWNAFGCNTSEQLIEQTADYFVSSGLKAAGYEYVNIDDCWQEKTRDANGQLVADPTKFPDGIKAVADYVHSKGLKLGIYEDAGTTTCGGYPGSLGHEQTDAETFASWGVDYLKYDQCNIPFANYPGETHEQIDQQLYTTMSNALAATGRPIVFSMCNGTDPAALPWLWGAPVSNLWRTTTDIQDNFASMVANVMDNAQLAQYAGPGHWNDPDMLEIGNGGMTDTEYKSEFSLWSEMAAPLIIGTDLRKATPETLAIYSNPDVIAVDQDSLGKQGVLLSSTDGHDVFAKPLANGDVAVALFNASGTAATISTTAGAVGLGHASAYQLKDLWSKQVTESAGAISAFVPAHGTVMYRVSTPKNVVSTVTETPNATLAVSGDVSQLGVGDSANVTVTLTDNGRTPVLAPRLSFAAPSGWTARKISGSTVGVALPTGRSLSVTYHVTAPSSAPPISTADFDATADDLSIAGSAHAASTLGLTLVSPVQAPYRAANTTGAAAVFGQSGSDFSIVAAGSGVGPATTRSAATDQYGAIYLAGAAQSDATVRTTVTSQPGAGRNAKAGIMIRDDATASNGSPEGVVLYVTGSGTVGMAWNASGGTTVDTATPTTGLTAQTLPVQLKLVRDGTNYTGYYSTDGTTWTQVGVATVAATAAATTQDVALFHTAGSAGATEADFTGLSLS
jgi:alpha-galactosidase